MLDQLLTEFIDIDALSDKEQRAVMVVKHDQAHGSIERFIRRVFVYAIVTRSSDVHIEGRGDRNTPSVFIHVRTPRGMVNMSYEGDHGKHFETKMFGVTGTPQGGSTGITISTRFSMALPAAYARKHGLMPQSGDAPYAIDLRVEYIKTFDSFCFTCRLLDQQRTPGLDDLNLPGVLLRAIKEASNEPSGLILASGPTGSGKTTLLNAVLGYLNDGQRSIVTIENPVEFRLKGPGPIKQLQVQGDFTFARALRSTLRADPDVILVGEIRDEETMKIAIEASKTGHLVLATVHANDGHGTISRLVEMGADPMNIADSLKLVMAQRILTSYSGEKKLRPLSRDESDWMSINGMGGNSFIAESVSGEKTGMVALIEAIRMEDEIKQVIRNGNIDSTTLYRLAKEQDQYESLASAGIRAVEAYGCKLQECKFRLESNSDAYKHPGKRIRLAKEYGLSLGQVAAAIDASYRSNEGGRNDPLTQILEEMKEPQCIAA
jgi:type II secretory ATPase GspE/PulE/Tfp pilus assembly ATPase PilB-like protein